MRFELTVPSLQDECSTIELNRPLVQEKKFKIIQIHSEYYVNSEKFVSFKNNKIRQTSVGQLPYK